MNETCPCCAEPLHRAGSLPLVRGTPRAGDLLCANCRWLTPRELRELTWPGREWCPTHGERARLAR